MSILGIIHTLVSLVPIVLAAILLFQQGHINPRSKLGFWYSLSTVAAVATAFTIMKTGKLSEGHFLGILILLLIGAAYLLPKLSALHNLAPLLERVLMSTSFFLMFIPTTVESLSRLPVGAPLAPEGPESPLVKQILGIIFLLYLAGLFWQYKKLKLENTKFSQSA